jgi:hypothetical protein
MMTCKNGRTKTNKDKKETDKDITSLTIHTTDDRLEHADEEAEKADGMSCGGD